MSALLLPILKGPGEAGGKKGTSMSVINQMLQDLDQRQAGTALGPVAMPVRPLPKRSGLGFGPWWWGLGLAMAAAGGGAWYYLRQGESARVVAPANPPSPTTIATSPPPSFIATAAPNELLPPPQLVDSLRLTAELSTVPSAGKGLPKEPPVSQGAAPAAVQPKLPETPKPAEPALPARPAGEAPGSREAKPAMVAVAAASTTPPFIDKQVRLSTPREKADYEYRRGLAAFNQGRSSEAQELLQAALREEPGHLSARQLLLKLLVEQRAMEEAKRLLLEGLALQPSQTGWAMALARMQMDGGDLRSALQTLEVSRAFGKDNADYCGLFGALLQRMQRHKDAAEQYRGALRQAPAEARWWIGLGVALEADGVATEARQAYQNARSAGGLTPELAGFVEQKLR